MFNKSGFTFVGETITGLVREHNEDNFLISAPEGRRTALAVIADGVGGHRHGEIVSYISCRDLGNAFNALKDEKLLEKEGAETFLSENIAAINKRVFAINYEEFTLHPKLCNATLFVRAIIQFFPPFLIFCFFLLERSYFLFSLLPSDASIRAASPTLLVFSIILRP